MKWSLHPLCAFAPLASEWDRLNRETTHCPLLSSLFLLPLLAQFSSGRERLACCRVDGALQAMLLLEHRDNGVWQTFQPPQAPLGAWVRRQDFDWTTGLPGLIAALPGMALVLGLTQLDPDRDTRPATSATLHTGDYIRTARITLTGSFEDYWNRRGRNLRQNLKKQHSKLARDGIVTRLQISTAPHEVAQAVTDYSRLESAGWKAHGGTAVQNDDRQGRFYRAMLENFCSAGRGRIYRYWYNQQLAAMDLCIEGPDSLIVLKTTYDEQLAGSTSPALLMRQEAVAQLFAESRLLRIEFYGKVLDWHTRWSDEIRTLFHVTLYRWRVLPLLRARMGNPRSLLRTRLLLRNTGQTAGPFPSNQDPPTR